MRALLLVLLGGCATLDTSAMSESCRRLYDACLNTCPGAARGSLPARPTTGPSFQIDVASCTSDCNDRAKQCR
ncbi:MAG: hypothetical protein JNM69_24210 [Archangium sp.]|nr:hypothetical protein [Archangium sp.]